MISFYYIHTVGLLGLQSSIALVFELIFHQYFPEMEVELTIKFRIMELP